MRQFKFMVYSMLLTILLVNWSGAWAQILTEKDIETMGLTSGKFGVYQVFDCQRSPSYPVVGQLFTASNLQRPYKDVGGRYTLLEGEYIQFFYVGGSCSAGKVGIRRYSSSNNLIETISASGVVWGLHNIGFLYVSDNGNYGTFVSNALGYSLGQSVSYTATSGQATCTDLETYNPNTEPLTLASITVVGTLNAFTTTTGMVSTAQTFTVSGVNLTADVVVTAPTNFEVSNDGILFTPSITLTQTSGSLAGQPITTHVRIAASATVGTFTGNVTIASTGAVTQNVAVSGTVSGPLTGISVTGTAQTQNTGLVTISYSLYCPEGGLHDIGVEVSFDGGLTYTLIPAAHLSGDLTNIQPGAGYSIVWNAAANYPGVSGNQMKIRVFSTLQ